MNVEHLKSRVNLALLHHRAFCSHLQSLAFQALGKRHPLDCLQYFTERSRKSIDQFAQPLTSLIIETHAFIMRELALYERDLVTRYESTDSKTDALRVMQREAALATAQSTRSHMEKLVATVKRLLEEQVIKSLRQSNREGTPFSAGFRESISATGEYRVLDAIGRRINSEVAFKTMLTQAWLNLWNDSIYFYTMSFGEDYLRIIRPGHEDDGMEFPVETYPNISRRLLHPNSWATIVAAT